MEQGVTNAPGTLARPFSTILGHLIGASVFTYFDDVFIHTSGSPEDHIRDVTTVLEVLERESLYCSINKSVFFLTDVEYLSSIVHVPSYTIRAQPEKIEKITSWLTPIN